MISRARIPLLVAVMSIGVLAILPAGAAATPESAAKALVHDVHKAKTRKGLGTPTLAAVLGRKKSARKRVAKAEAKMIAAMTNDLAARPLGGRASGTPALWGTDLDADLGLSRDRFDRATQKFSLKLTLDPCPDPGVPSDPNGTLHGTVDGKHRTVTEERINGLVFRTLTLFSIRGDFGMSTDRFGVLREGVKFANLVVVIERARQVRRARSGRVIAEADASAQLDFNPITGVIGEEPDTFEAWVAEQEREEDGDPPGSTPPPDRLSSRSYNQAANRLLTMIEEAVTAAGKSAQPHWLTPNACVALDLEYPPTAAPGETGVVIKGHPKAGASASLILTEPEYLGGMFSYSQISGEPFNGIAASSPAAYPLKPGDIWYLADMPAQQWTAANAPALKVTMTSKGGTAESTATFAPATSDNFDVFLTGSDQLAWDMSYTQHPPQCHVAYVITGNRTFTFRADGQMPNGVASKTSQEGEPFEFIGAAYPPSTVQHDGVSEVHYTPNEQSDCNSDTAADTSGCTGGPPLELNYGLNADLRWSAGKISAVFSIPSGNYSQLDDCPLSGDGPTFGTDIITAEAALPQATIEDKTKSVITVDGTASDDGPKSTHSIHWTLTLRRK